jgi:tetratricopeptide (TPR) repeat protein
MKRLIALALLLLLSHSFARAQTPTPPPPPPAPTSGPEPSTQQQLARDELQEATNAYKRGDFSEAELRSRRALEIDPENTIAPFFIARSVHAQYRQGLETPENLQLAERAIEAYKRIMSKDVNNDEAYKAVAFLLGQMGRTDEQRDWISQRAENPSVEPAKRAEAYAFLANKGWECSFQITERKENQRSVRRGGQTFITWRMPRDLNDFDKAKQCVARGLEFVEQAVTLSPEYVNAWAFKTNLLLEMVKLSEMEGNTRAREDYKKQADDARARLTTLTGKPKEPESDKQREDEGTKEQEPKLWPPPAPKGNP